MPSGPGLVSGYLTGAADQGAYVCGSSHGHGRIFRGGAGPEIPAHQAEADDAAAGWTLPAAPGLPVEVHGQLVPRHGLLLIAWGRLHRRVEASPVPANPDRLVHRAFPRQPVLRHELVLFDSQWNIIAAATRVPGVEYIELELSRTYAIGVSLYDLGWFVRAATTSRSARRHPVKSLTKAQDHKAINAERRTGNPAKSILDSPFGVLRSKFDVQRWILCVLCAFWLSRGFEDGEEAAKKSSPAAAARNPSQPDWR
jgi:hypothetical protein